MEFLLIFSVSLSLLIATTSTSPVPIPKLSHTYQLTSKLKFVGDEGDISLEPAEFVDLRLRYILNQSTSDIQDIRALQQEELSLNELYKEDWIDGLSIYQEIGKWEEIEQAFQNSSVILEVPKEYHQALSIYSYVLYYHFNVATRELCSALDIQGNYTYKSFFKLLHLAMETMGPEIAKITHNETHVPLYRGLGIKYSLNIGQEVTFQHFTSTTMDLGIAEYFSGEYGSIIEIQPDEDNPINPRHKISLMVHSIFPGEKEVLLSPLQSFVVHNITDHYNSYGIIQPKVILKPNKSVISIREEQRTLLIK